jgi:hypothetical protein
MGNTAGYTVTLTCPVGESFSAVAFASYGLPTGVCGNYKLGACHSAITPSVVASKCLNKTSCALKASSAEYPPDPCVGTLKQLLVQLTCSTPPLLA